MPKIKIDGTEYDVADGTTVMHACEDAGAEIPRFCFHDRLSIAGNCRMCLVEVKGAPKPQASCGLSVNDLRPGPDGAPPEIFTNTPYVKKAREGVMEFMLINHPLDCPICDQGGECDLQDQAMGYGIAKNRFAEDKRAIADPYIGPLVKTIMTRCIKCTRCVRFTTEVGGVEELGATGRGEDIEITTYLQAAMKSELQGNVIDLCPVGALTSAAYEFKARPWELRKTETIDVMDALGSNIRVDARGREVMRIVPRNNDAINEEWISDKTRFIWDGLNARRLDRPYVRNNKGKLVEASWDEAFAAIADKMKSTAPEKIGAIAGDLAGAEEMFALKMLMDNLGSQNIDCRVDGSQFDPSKGRATYLFNSTVAGIEEADMLMIIGSNPRLESPVLNARIRKRWLAGNFPIAMIGEQADLTYDYIHVGDDPAALAKFENHKPAKAKRPMFIIGPGAFACKDGGAILASAARAAIALGVVNDDWNGFNILHSAAARVAGLDLGLIPGKGGDDAVKMAGGSVDLLFNLGADEIDIKDGPFVIYQGSHGDKGANRADVILPGATYTEKSAIYVNTEGRPQMTNKASFPPGDAKDDWAILRALSDRLGQALPFDTIEQLRALMFEAAPHLAELGTVTAADAPDIATLAKGKRKSGKAAFKNTITNFYMTNPIARASKVMAQCSDLRYGAIREAAE
ncbi:NADH-ubiquinone oxidoreductase chain G [hydrothermal vent metagenome]|uniref:NADH-ubiquinone oxidoreductase chain G n=1 Tax=hydrothermal vent metagenome TaxID=652676 RepID=A0A3B0RTM4_9ZZZZ